jgi:hypothetical protein
MRGLLRLAPVLVVLAGALPVKASETVQPIHDDAHLFQPVALEQAREKIAQLQERWHLGFRLDTLTDLPQDLRTKMQKAGKPAVEFQTWAKQRAEHLEVEGIYVLISQEPKHKAIAVVVRPEELQKTFTARDCKRVGDLLNKEISRGQPNTALLEALDRVQELVQYNVEGGYGVWVIIGWVILGLLALRVLFLLIQVKLEHAQRKEQQREQYARQVEAARAAQEAAQAAAQAAQMGPPPSPNTPDKDHQGLMPAMLGGLFGTMAGHWIYDSLFRRSAPKPEQPPAEAPPASPPAQPDADSADLVSNDSPGT